MNDSKKKRVRKARESALDNVAPRVHQALVVATGAATAPTIEQVREAVATIMEFVDHPDYADQEYFATQYGALIRVNRDAGKFWHTFQVFVPATAGVLWYLEQE